jgi:hypothetical protein
MVLEMHFRQQSTVMSPPAAGTWLQADVLAAHPESALEEEILLAALTLRRGCYI